MSYVFHGTNPGVRNMPKGEDKFAQASTVIRRTRKIRESNNSSGTWKPRSILGSVPDDQWRTKLHAIRPRITTPVGGVRLGNAIDAREL